MNPIHYTSQQSVGGLNQVVPKEGQITGACRELENSIENALKSASALTTRLNDCCVPQQPENKVSTDVGPPSTVPLAEKLQQFNRSVRSINEQLQDLLNRCHL